MIETIRDQEPDSRLPISPSPRRATMLLAISIAAASATVGLLFAYSDWPREAVLMTGIFVLAALLWTTEAIPLFATSLVVVGLEMLLLANPGNWDGLGFENGSSPTLQTILSTAIDPVLLLFFGGFLLARAAVQEGVDKGMAALLLRPFGTSPLLVLLGIMVATALFSMWMSNTATTAMMIALISPLLLQMDERERFAKALLLGVPFAANLGGMGTPIASPPNAVAVGYLRKAGHEVDFLEWMAVAVPLMTGLLIFTWLLLFVMYRPQTSSMRLRVVRPPLTGRGIFVVVVFAITVVLWLSEAWHGLPAAVVALVPAVAFTASGLLSRKDVDSLDWSILLLIAGGIALGAGMQMTKLDTILVGYLTSYGGGASVAVAIAMLVGATVLLSTFMSNTAASNLLLPVGVSFAATLGSGTGHAIPQAGISIALAASAAMALPVSTPPNAIAFSRGRLTVRDMAVPGTIIAVVTALLVTAFGGPIIRFWSERVFG